MRKLILGSLAALALTSTVSVAAAVGEGVNGTNVHAQDITSMLGGKVSHVQVADVQAIFNNASLGGVRLNPAVARTGPDFEASDSLIGDLLPAEGGSSGAILLAGALVVVAVVLRRLS